MQHKPSLDALLAALDASLVQLEMCRADASALLIRPILLRRRRARVALRALLSWAGHPQTGHQPGGTGQTACHSLFGLWRAEQKLIGLYDAALEHTANLTLEKALLTAQRAEAEDAYLTITAAIQDRNRYQVPIDMSYRSFA